MRNYHFVFLLVFLAGLGLLVGRAWVHYAPVVQAWWSGPTLIYESPDATPETTEIAETIGWAALLPKNHAVVLEKFQSPGELSFSEQVTRSIEAGKSTQYRAALYSTDIEEEALGRPISLPGFIVPLMLEENRQVSSFFIVPYFGACIHYPPPPPNQMVYVSLPRPIALPDINAPYLFSGALESGLFEDLLGTSAYIMQVAQIKPYQQHPDDVRVHTQE